jgi:hypothetical protein
MTPFVNSAAHPCSTPLVKRTAGYLIDRSTKSEDSEIADLLSTTRRTQCLSKERLYAEIGGTCHMSDGTCSAALCPGAYATWQTCLYGTTPTLCPAGIVPEDER